MSKLVFFYIYFISEIELHFYDFLMSLFMFFILKTQEREKTILVEAPFLTRHLKNRKNTYILIVFYSYFIELFDNFQYSSIKR